MGTEKTMGKIISIGEETELTMWGRKCEVKEERKEQRHRKEWREGNTMVNSGKKEGLL